MLVATINLGNLGNLRGTQLPDQEPMWSIRDFINVMNEKPISDPYGMITWNRMLCGEHKNELITICCQLIIPGSQGRETPCASILGLQTIAALLPGKIAAKYRQEVRDIFNRVIMGDTSLIQIIENNSSTSTPMQEVLRDAYKRQGEDPEDRLVKRRKIEMEMQKMQAEIDVMRAETKHKLADAEHKLVETTNMRINNIQEAEKMYTRLCIGGIMDDRARLMFKDGLTNAAGIMPTQQQEKPIDERPLTISTFVTELKIKMNNSQGIQAGRIMARLYREKYGSDPSTHEQFVDGAVRKVKSYTREHTDLMEQAIKEATK